MRVFRKVVLPVVWVLIFGAIAISLAVIAFGSDPKPKGSGLTPTGDIPASNTVVGRDTVENILKVSGTITVDPPVGTKAVKDGVINHFFVPVGAKVRAGDSIYQIRADAPVEENDGSQDEPKTEAKPRYVNVLAPVSGRVGAYTKELDDSVTKGEVVTSIQLSTFRATGSVTPLDQYRLVGKPKSATVTIAGGPAPFKCGDLEVADTSGEQGDSTDGTEGEEGQDVSPGAEEGSGQSAPAGGGASISCQVPENVKVFNSLEMRMSIDAGRAEDVLVVPVTAVRGLVDNGTVWVIEDGKPTKRAVSLGVSDGTIVEISAGVKEGEEILEFVPGSDDESGNNPRTEEMM